MDSPKLYHSARSSLDLLKSFRIHCHQIGWQRTLASEHCDRSDRLQRGYGERSDLAVCCADTGSAVA